MNILFTICARAGSKGVPSKNIKFFCGEPLVYYTLRVYEKYLKKNRGSQDRVDLAVNTDSMQLLEQINGRGTGYIFIERKKELAGDLAAKGDVIRDTLLEAEGRNRCGYDMVVDLDITSPLRSLADVEGTMGLVAQGGKCNFAYSVVESRRNPYFNMVCRNGAGFYDRVIPSEFTARQQVPQCFDMNASIYAYGRGYLSDMRPENRFALVWEMQDSGVLDIDGENDFEVMEILAGYYWEHGRYLDIKNT